MLLIKKNTHGLRCSASPVLTPNGDWLCQWEMAIFDPHRIHTPWPITKKFVASDYVGDGFPRLMAQTTRIRARMCILGVSLTLLPILGVKYPKNPNFWSVNRRFQAKRAKYWKFHVIETTASISRKFCTTIETIKNWSWVVPIGAQQIQDGGRPPFWKKNVKSLYLCNRLTDFDKIWYSDAHWPLTADLSLKFRIFENPKWRRPSSWKITKIAISP